MVTSGVWGSPIYKRFLEAVKSVNAELPPGKRVRVIAGDPPIDWSKVHTSQEAAPFFRARDEHPVKVIASEVLSRSRKALVIYGGAHFYRSGRSCAHSGTLLAGLENLVPGKIFTILPLGGDDDFSRNFQKLAGVDQMPFFLSVKNSKSLAWVKGDMFFGEAKGSLSDFTDGVLYLGPQPDTFREPPLIHDQAYREELARRKRLLAGAGCMPVQSPGTGPHGP